MSAMVMRFSVLARRKDITGRALPGRLKNRHSGARRRREPGIHSHNTIILACLYDEATGVMDSGLLASLGPGMTRTYANVPRKRATVLLYHARKGCWSLTMALRTVRSFLATAMIASFVGFPALIRVL